MLLKPGFKYYSLLTLLFFVAGVFFAPAAFAALQATTIVIDGQELNLDTPPLFENGRILLPVRSLAAGLGADVSWDAVTRTATVVKGNNTVKLTVGSKTVIWNGNPIFLDSPITQLVQGRLMIPLRVAAQTLGATVEWNNQTRTVMITMPKPAPAPERVYNAAFPARVAFTNNGHLWLVNGSQAGAAPVQITREGTAQIVGWSRNGQWLMYLKWASDDIYRGEPHLWVAKADGTGAFQVDEKAVVDKPAWSPTASTAAYFTQNSSGYPDLDLKVAVIQDGKATVTSLLPGSSSVVDFAWAPDGQSLAISLARTQKQPLLIDQISLKGERNNLLTLGEPIKPEDGIYLWAATGFKWSPNGRFLAYHLRPNSGSLSADGVGIQVLDLKQPRKPLDFSGGLSYAEWLAWSPDSTHLAYIEGGGREATINKHLFVVDMQAGGKATNYGAAGKVDTNPVWTTTPPYGVIFSRGTETAAWLGKEGAGVLAPGQRIWLQPINEKDQVLTSGPPQTADYLPLVSPAGQDLTFLRLDRNDMGSLYGQPLTGGRESELIRGLSGDLGYYGNYYPGWLSIYWEQ